MADDFDLLGSLVVYSYIVAVLHLEENVVSVRILRPGDEVAFEYLARIAGYSEEAANTGPCLLQMGENFSVVSFQLGCRQAPGLLASLDGTSR